MNQSMNKIILALDFDSSDVAKEWVKKTEVSSRNNNYIKDRVNNSTANSIEDKIGIQIFKVGLNLFINSGFYIVDWILDRGLDVMLDLKLYDVPKTIESVVKQISKHKIKYLTIYCNYYSVKAAIEVKQDIELLLVNRLTSHSKNIAYKQIVSNYITMKQCINKGANGIITPCSDIPIVREIVGDEPIIITPGIRWNNFETIDQLNTCSPKLAIDSGANYIVIGRPITLSENPLETIRNIQV